MNSLPIALAQLNAHVGDVDGNIRRMLDGASEAEQGGARMIIYPELMISGYPPEDLLLRPHFLDRCRRGLETFAKQLSPSLSAVVGVPLLDGSDLFNSLAIIAEQRIVAVYHKMHLPNYGVFDEQRYFAAGSTPGMINVNGTPIGISVCEDIWLPRSPMTAAALAGAQLVINASASPYHIGKGAERERMLAQRARDNLTAIAYTNLVGGQDELVFDGGSMIVDHRGEVLVRGPQFTEAVIIADIPLAAATAARLRDPHNRRLLGRDPGVAESQLLAELAIAEHTPVSVTPSVPVLARNAEIYQALVTGTRDYVAKNGFSEVVLGLSGGIDSALVALIAVDALGPDRVHCLVMPSTYSSDASQTDAETLAAQLGIDCRRIEISAVMTEFDRLLEPHFSGRDFDVTEENLQARIRCNLLMACSNKFGWLVLACSNKSESSLGYSTLYGDSAGGVLPIADVPKLMVYQLVAWRNEQLQVMPPSIQTRPPSAELRPGQVDTDSLPPYQVLDPIIDAYVNHDQSLEEIVAAGYDRATVARVIGLLDRAEYKRRQLGPVIKITSRAYGRDWRLPLTNGYLPGGA
jgi:NAD+ synthase (glutamine-hydrolysing)